MDTTEIICHTLDFDPFHVKILLYDTQDAELIITALAENIDKHCIKKKLEEISNTLEQLF